VKAVLMRALRNDPLFSRDRQPEVLIVDFAASSINYRIRVWTTDFAADTRVSDHVRSHIYYAFRRHNISIPYPIQVQYEASAPVAEQAAPSASIGSVEILASLSDEQRVQLLQNSRPALYAVGETIVSEGDAGSSMFVVVRGEAIVTLAGTDGEVARFGPGAFFGEMSLLTGEPRTATVSAVTDCEVLEIGVEAFRRVVVADPAVLERVTVAVAARRAGLEMHRATRSAPAGSPDAPHTFLDRVRHFLRLSA
jgi:CRP-like cAMP-binding protein